MSFDVNKLSSDPIQRLRLTTGDISEFPILEDGVYEFQLFQSATEDEAALVCLENIINFVTLNPTQVTLGDAKAIVYDLNAFESRYEALKFKIEAGATGSPKTPIIIKSDRKDWSDFDFFKYKK